MSLTLKEVEHIAELARLQLTPEEMERYRQQLSSILDHVAQLQKLDTSGIPPTSSILQAGSRLRKDERGESLLPDEVLKNSKLIENDQFRVPPVFGEIDG